MRATGTENEPPREQLASAVDSVERLAQQYEARKRRKHERNQATTLKRKTTLELPLRAQFGLPERGSDKHVAKAWLCVSFRRGLSGEC